MWKQVLMDENANGWFSLSLSLSLSSLCWGCWGTLPLKHLHRLKHFAQAVKLFSDLRSNAKRWVTADSEKRCAIGLIGYLIIYTVFRGLSLSKRQYIKILITGSWISVLTRRDRLSFVFINSVFSLSHQVLTLFLKNCYDASISFAPVKTKTLAQSHVQPVFFSSFSFLGMRFIAWGPGLGDLRL